MDPVFIGLIGIVVLIALVVLGMKVWLALTIVSLVGIILIRDFELAVASIRNLPYNDLARYGLAVIPLFILMGELFHQFGFSQELFKAAQRYLSSLKGGMLMTVITVSAIFAAISGSGMASSAVIGKMALPEMVKAGYDKSVSAGTIAASSTFASMIPPSAHLVIYGFLTFQSVGELFIAAIIPGIISAAIYFGYMYFWALKNPDKVPPTKPFVREKFLTELKITSRAWPTALVIALIIGGIYLGIFTPNEAGAAGAFAVILLGLLNRTVTGSKLLASVLDTVKTTGSIFIIYLGSMFFVRFLAHSRLPYVFTESMLALPLPETGILLCVLLVFIVLGAFIPPLALLMIAIPIVYPTIEALGVHPVWFGILVIKTIEMGMITPPVGINCFIIGGLMPKEVPLDTVFKGAARFLVLDFITLFILIAFPVLSLYLPARMM